MKVTIHFHLKMKRCVNKRISEYQSPRCKQMLYIRLVEMPINILRFNHTASIRGRPTPAERNHNMHLISGPH